MSSYATFVEKWNTLAKLLKQKPYVPIPEKVWSKQANDLEKLISALTPYFTEPKAPSKTEIDTVKKHPITSNIKASINKDKPHKTFFTGDYFKEKCTGLPDKALLQQVLKGSTRDAYLTAFLVYHYWKNRPDTQRGLELAGQEIESDYRNSPEVKRVEEARALFRDLLGESDLNRLTTILRTTFPDKVAIEAFAKTVGLKVPSGKKPIHERLAAKIMASGEIVRAKF